MPVYEYKCKVCDERFEIEQKITDDALTSLPGCRVADAAEHRLKKVFSAIGIAFKGDGFYRNDARGKRTTSTSSSDSSTSSSSDSSTSSSSDSSTSSSGDSSTSSSSTATTTPSDASGSSGTSSSNGGNSSSN